MEFVGPLITCAAILAGFAISLYELVWPRRPFAPGHVSVVVATIWIVGGLGLALFVASR